MKYLFVTYYFPPDIGAGSFRSISFLKSFLKIIGKKDIVHIITTEPNRYDNKKRVKKIFKIDDSRVIVHKIKLINHKEKFIPKVFCGIIYFFYSCKLIFKINPNFCLASSARLISALSVYVVSFFRKYNYSLDIRDIFSESLKDIIKKVPFKNYILIIIRFLEKLIFERAVSVNFVSKGFNNYLKKYFINIKKKTFFTNGLDKIFNRDQRVKKIEKIKKLLYVGNIGEGQGLHKLIPEILNNSSELRIKIIGDGGKKKDLLNKIEVKDLKKIKILKPRNQIKLLPHYMETDALLLNLNNYNAFKNVIPSKFFEYLSFNKIIFCGVNGYTKKFCNQFFNIYFFKSSDPKSFTKSLSLLKKKLPIRTKSNYIKLKKYNREKIMHQYALSILNLNRF
jgi:hypothetical protein